MITNFSSECNLLEGYYSIQFNYVRHCLRPCSRIKPLLVDLRVFDVQHGNRHIPLISHQYALDSLVAISFQDPAFFDLC